MTVLTPPGYVQGGTYTAKLDRIYLGTLGYTPNLGATFSARQGFFNGRVPVVANPSGMNVTIGACGGIIANTFASASGDYLFANDATVQVTSAASSPTQNRYDIIGFQVKDNLFDSSGLNTAVPAIIQGSNSAGTPSDPALPASFIPVTRAVVNAGVTSPTLQSLIRKTAAEGGVIRVASVTERAEITAHEGLEIYREDRDWVEIHDGAAWRVHGVAICSSTADRNTAITNPRDGQLAITTDADILWTYDGATSAWRRLTGGYRIEKKSSASTALSTTEAVVDFFTFDAIAGHKYTFRFRGVYGTAATNYFFRFRWKLGATVDVLGTIFDRLAPNGISGLNLPISLEAEWVAPTTAQYTLVLGCVLGSGTGDIPNDGTNHVKYAALDYLGA